MQLKANVIPKGSELVAEVGDWGLYKSTLTLRLSSEDKTKDIKVNHIKLLTAGDDDDIYIDIEIVLKVSGFDEKQLAQMIKKDKIKSRKLKDKVYVSLISLIDFLSKKL